MREPPAELVELRRRARESYGWRREGRAVTEEQRARMTDAQQGECRWGADPAIVDELVAAETAFTRTFGAVSR